MSAIADRKSSRGTKWGSSAWREGWSKASTVAERKPSSQTCQTWIQPAWVRNPWTSAKAAARAWVA